MKVKLGIFGSELHKKHLHLLRQKMKRIPPFYSHNNPENPQKGTTFWGPKPFSWKKDRFIHTVGESLEMRENNVDLSGADFSGLFTPFYLWWATKMNGVSLFFSLIYIEESLWGMLDIFKCHRKVLADE